jgi:hypothetical protein
MKSSSMEAINLITLYDVDKTVMHRCKIVAVPSSVTGGSMIILNIQKLLRSFHMWRDTPETMTHFEVASEVRGQVDCESVAQSPVVGIA